MRYIVLLLLNVPIISIALLNLITKYKLGRVSKRRFKIQMTLWSIFLTILILSFPAYNYLAGRAPLDSQELSFFDIFQTTAIVFLIYIVNDMRQKIQWNERTLRDFHQELSIKLSANDNDKDKS